MQITLQELKNALTAYDEGIGLWFFSRFFRARCIDQLHRLVFEYEEQAPRNTNLDVARMLAIMQLFDQPENDVKDKEAVDFIKQQIPILVTVFRIYETLNKHHLFEYIRKKNNHYFSPDVETALTFMLEQKRLTPANFKLLLRISPSHQLCRYSIAKFIVELDEDGLLTQEYSNKLVAAVMQDSQHLDMIIEDYLRNKAAVGGFIPDLLQHLAPKHLISVINIVHKCDANFLKTNPELQSKVFALDDKQLSNLQDQLLSCQQASQLERLVIFIQKPALYLCNPIAREMSRLPSEVNTAECFQTIQDILAIHAGNIDRASNELAKHIDKISNDMREQKRNARKPTLMTSDDNNEAQVSLNLFQPDARAEAPTPAQTSSLKFGIG